MQVVAVLLVVLAGLGAGRLAPETADYRTSGVVFDAAPPCTIPFHQEVFSFAFRGKVVAERGVRDVLTLFSRRRPRQHDAERDHGGCHRLARCSSGLASSAVR